MFGLEFVKTVVSRQEVLSLEVDSPQKLLYPPSVTGLVPPLNGDESKPKSKILGANLAVLALVGLLSRGLLEVHRAKLTGLGLIRGDGYFYVPGSIGESFRSIFRSAKNNPIGQGVVYLITPGNVTSPPIVEGTLEGRILGLVRNWAKSSYAYGWPLPPTIYLLVKAIFGRTHHDPNRWLLNLVREDAVALGLFTKQTRLWSRVAFYEPASCSARQLFMEKRAMLAWKGQVAQNHPEFVIALDDEIRSAIGSQETTG